MKMNIYYALIPSVLILASGCKKSINSSVDLTGGAKAGFASNPQWQTPTASGRLVRYDVGDGFGSDCIVSYDLSSGVVTMTKINGTTSTTLSAPSIGFNTDQSPAFAIYVGTWNTDVTDNYNEIGGVHIIPFDYNGTGHEDHLLVYIPGHGLAYIIHYQSASNNWHVDWTSDSGNHTSGSGIGGYDIMATNDKIIAYDYSSSGHTKDLICYRPTKGIFYCLQNTGNGFTPVVRSTGGVGGYDLAGASDQLFALEAGVGLSCDLVAYRPGYGYVYWMNHSANSTSWTTQYITRSGFPDIGGSGINFPLSHTQDRMMNYYNTSLAAGTAPFWYSPGNGPSGSSWIYYWTGYALQGNYRIFNNWQL